MLRKHSTAICLKSKSCDKISGDNRLLTNIVNWTQNSNHLNGTKDAKCMKFVDISLSPGGNNYKLRWGKTGKFSIEES